MERKDNAAERGQLASKKGFPMEKLDLSKMTGRLE